MSTRDEIEHAVDLFGSAMHDLAITHCKGKDTEKDLAVYTRRRLELINLFAPPAPGEVRLTLSREQAEGVSRDLHYWIGHWGGLSFESIEALSVVDAALEAAAAPEQS